MATSDRPRVRTLLKEVATGVLLEFVVVEVVHRLRHRSTPSDAASSRKKGLLRDILIGASVELVQMARADVRWQRHRMAAAIDRAAVAQSISGPPVTPHIPTQRAEPPAAVTTGPDGSGTRLH